MTTRQHTLILVKNLQYIWRGNDLTGRTSQTTWWLTSMRALLFQNKPKCSTQDESKKNKLVQKVVINFHKTFTKIKRIRRRIWAYSRTTTRPQLSPKKVFQAIKMEAKPQAECYLLTVRFRRNLWATNMITKSKSYGPSKMRRWSIRPLSLPVRKTHTRGSLFQLKRKTTLISMTTAPYRAISLSQKKTRKRRASCWQTKHICQGLKWE